MRMRVFVSLCPCVPSSVSAERSSDRMDLHASRSDSGSDMSKSLPSPSHCMPRLECDEELPCDTAFSQPIFDYGAKQLNFSLSSFQQSSCDSAPVPSAIKPFPIDAAQTWHADSGSKTSTVAQPELNADIQCPPSPFIMSDQNVPFLSAEQLVELSPIHSPAAEYRQAQCMRRRAVSAPNLQMESASACEETIAETHRHLTALVGESAHLPKQHLIRPAFRLIFDIARHAVRHSAFASGVFTVNELDPRPSNQLFSNVKSKAAFLRKLIRATNDAVDAAGLQVVHADCRDILAGRCAKTTNLLLQNIGRLALATKVGKLATCGASANTIEAPALPAPALGIDASRPGKCSHIAAYAGKATAGAASDLANEMGAMSIFDLLAME